MGETIREGIADTGNKEQVWHERSPHRFRRSDMALNQVW